MPVTFDRSAEPGVVRLEGALDIADAAELKQALLEALASQQQSRISLESATGIDITTVQLLWAAERERTASGAALVLEGPVPEALSAMVREAGFDRFPLAGSPEPKSETKDGVR